MKKQYPDLLKKVSELAPLPTAHGSGKKFVFRSNEELDNCSTQVAFGFFEQGEVCEEHIHPTMFEYFYFIEGRGTYKIEGVNYDIEPGSFLEIPPQKLHSLHADKNEQLKFVYWGVAID